MAKIRLLELRSASKGGGGPEKTILLSAERHDPSRVSVVVAYLRTAGDRDFLIGRMARARGLTFYEIEDRGKFDPRVLRIIRDIVVRHEINLVHAHDYKTDLFAYFLRGLLGRRRFALVSTAHAWVMLGLRGELYRRLDFLVMRSFDHLIAVSHATKAEMVAGGVPADLISVVHNAIDTVEWSPRGVTSNLREELGLAGAFPVIGYVGRFSREKDLETWLQVAARVVVKYPAARFVLVGEGRDSNMRESLSRLAVRLGISERVVYLGYRERLQSVYPMFDVFMLSSRREGLPNCLLESMSLGVPVVTTDVAGVKELVVDGETGFVRAMGDPQGLYEALLVLLGRDELRLRMGRAARQRVEAQFSFTERMRCIEALYERVLCVGGATIGNS